METKALTARRALTSDVSVIMEARPWPLPCLSSRGGVHLREARAMTKRHLPSIQALMDSDDDLLDAELKVRELREQLAIARSLLDAVDGLVPVSEPEQPSVGEQAELAVEELARLGCKIVELASHLSRAAAPVSTVSVVPRAS